MDTYCEKVEQVLLQFPLDCRYNYEENKQTLRVNYENPIIKKLHGTYDHEKNIIDLYLVGALPHELFHMAFRDSNKVGMKIYEDEDMVYENGVSFSFICNGNKVIYGKGATEGFAEWFLDCVEFINEKIFNIILSIY